jgi:hypothetical protein
LESLQEQNILLQKNHQHQQQRETQLKKEFDELSQKFVKEEALNKMLKQRRE